MSISSKFDFGIIVIGGLIALVAFSCFQVMIFDIFFPGKILLNTSISIIIDILASLITIATNPGINNKTV